MHQPEAGVGGREADDGVPSGGHDDRVHGGRVVEVEGWAGRPASGAAQPVEAGDAGVCAPEAARDGVVVGVAHGDDGERRPVHVNGMVLEHGGRRASQRLQVVVDEDELDGGVERDVDDVGTRAPTRTARGVARRQRRTVVLEERDARVGEDSRVHRRLDPVEEVLGDPAGDRGSPRLVPVGHRVRVLHPDTRAERGRREAGERAVEHAAAVARAADPLRGPRLGPVPVGDHGAAGVRDAVPRRVETPPGPKGARPQPVGAATDAPLSDQQEVDSLARVHDGAVDPYGDDVVSVQRQQLQAVSVDGHRVCSLGARVHQAEAASAAVTQAERVQRQRRVPPAPPTVDQRRAVGERRDLAVVDGEVSQFHAVVRLAGAAVPPPGGTEQVGGDPLVVVPVGDDHAERARDRRAPGVHDEKPVEAVAPRHLAVLVVPVRTGGAGSEAVGEVGAGPDGALRHLADAVHPRRVCDVLTVPVHGDRLAQQLIGHLHDNLNRRTRWWPVRSITAWDACSLV